MALITRQQLENAYVDVATIEEMVNGSASLNGDGTLTSRLGQVLKTLARLQAEFLELDPRTVTASGSSVPRSLELRFAGIGDALDEAAGDGTTDDKAALEALDSRGYINFLTGSYRVASDLTLSSVCYFANGAKLTVDSGAKVRLMQAPVAGRHQIFSGDGLVEIGVSCTAYPEWWGSDEGAFQRCIEGTYRGTSIQPAGKYIVSGLTLEFPRDESKSIIGVGGPARKFSNNEIGAALYLSAGANRDVIHINGKSWSLGFDAGSVEVKAGDTVTGATSGATGVALTDGTLDSGSYAGGDAAGELLLKDVSGTFEDNEDLRVGGATVAVADGTASQNAGARAHIELDRLMLNGNKGSQTAGHGLSLEEVKDVHLGWIYIRNTKENGLHVPAGAGVNQLFISVGVDVNGADGVGHFLNGLADSYFSGVLVAGSCGSHGVQHSNGNVQYSIVRAFQNGGHGVNIVGNAGQFPCIKCNHNGLSGVSINANNVQIGLLHTYDNGQDDGASVALRAGLRLGSSASDVHIDVLRTTDSQGSPTQQYHIRDDAAGSDIRVDAWYYDDNAAAASLRVDSTARDKGHHFGQASFQSLAYAASVSIDPYKGRHVRIGALTGDLTLQQISALMLPDGLELTLELLQDATGGHTVTFGTGWSASTVPSTAANARTIISFVASGGVLYEKNS